MNRIQRYSKQLVDANNDVGERRGVALVWRGQAIDRIALPEAPDDTSDAPAQRPSDVTAPPLLGGHD